MCLRRRLHHLHMAVQDPCHFNFPSIGLSISLRSQRQLAGYLAASSRRQTSQHRCTACRYLLRTSARLCCRVNTVCLLGEERCLNLSRLTPNSRRFCLVILLFFVTRGLHGYRNYTHTHPSPQILYQSPSSFTSIPTHPRRTSISSPLVPTKISFHPHSIPASTTVDRI